MRETHHSAVDCRRVEMATSNIFCLIFLTTLVTVVWGLSLEELRVKRQVPTSEECMRPPMKRLAHECCRLPKERIWGDLKSSLNKCTPRRRFVPQMPNDDAERMPQREAEDGARPRGRQRPFGVRPHHFRRRVDDQCFMECVFEDQGFLYNQRVSKDALLERLRRTLGSNEKWLNVAMAGVEACHAPDTLEVSTNSTCLSGSEEIFRCVFKHIFFNCPSWPQRNEYCNYLRDYYQRCPEGPPPESEEPQTTAMPEATSEATSEASEPEEEVEEVTTTEEPSDE